MFITMNVTEGDVYKVGEVKVAGTMKVPESQLQRPADGQVRPDLLAQADHPDPGTHVLPPRRGRLRIREDRPGAAGERGDQDDRPHFLRGRGQPCLREARQLHQHERDRRRSSAARDAPDGGLLPVERAARTVQGTPAAPALHRGSRLRDDPGARHARPGRRRLQREGGPAGAVQRRHRLLRVAVVHAEWQLRALELHGLGRARRARARHWPLLATVQPFAHRPVHQHRRRVADHGAAVPRRHAVRVGGVGLLDHDDVRDARIRLPDLRVPGPALRRRRAASRT